MGPPAWCRVDNWINVTPNTKNNWNYDLHNILLVLQVASNNAMNPDEALCPIPCVNRVVFVGLLLSYHMKAKEH